MGQLARRVLVLGPPSSGSHSRYVNWGEWKPGMNAQWQEEGYVPERALHSCAIPRRGLHQALPAAPNSYKPRHLLKLPCLSSSSKPHLLNMPSPDR